VLEIDVDVRWLIAFGGNEALEQQIDQHLTVGSMANKTLAGRMAD